MHRYLWVGLGYFSLFLAATGAVLPLMPTVPFLITAAFCFSKGSEKLHRWLLEHPIFGHPIRDWVEKRVIRKRAKVIAASTMTFSVVSVWYFTPDQIGWLRFLVSFVILSALCFILVQRSE